ncbi:hypothetical protein ACFCX4_30495 [Kitasatospora sp. NPDC056327]|uniref:hypothetical protein n=1 Tax=Kitasatospora sp. NPDC056327 TaxID=3345785 RepID=UPI0035D67A6D
MTSDGKTALALLVSAGLLLGTAACSSPASGGSGSGAGTDGAKLSYAKLKSAVQGLGADPSCPFGLDLAAALKAGGIDRSVTPASATGKAVRADVVPAEAAPPPPSGPKPSGPAGALPGRPENIQVWCSYTAGTSPVEIAVLAAPAEKVAVNLALPYIGEAGGLTADQLVTASADQPAPGEARTTPGRASVGIARVAVADKGDLAVVVSQGTEAVTPDAALTGEPLRGLAQRLAAQLHL